MTAALSRTEEAPVPGPGEALVTATVRDGRLADESGSRPRPPGKTVLVVR